MRNVANAAISVIIPTGGARPEIGNAVASALRQSREPSEVIVVQCGSGSSVTEFIPEYGVDPRIAIRRIESRNANAARMVGIECASSTTVALLDDDDEWLSDHLAVGQRNLMRSRSESLPTVTASRVLRRRQGAADSMMPRRTYTGGSVAEYLFGAYEYKYGGALLHTSTLLFPRELALRVPWRRSLPRHQDWDWILRVHRAGAEICHSDAVTCVVNWDMSKSSVSRGTRWVESLDWVNGMLAEGLVTDDQWSNIVLTVTSDLAWQAGERREALRLVWAALRAGTKPAIKAPQWIARTARHLKGT